MKEYRMNMRAILWILLPTELIGILSLYFEEWFSWSVNLHFALCVCILPVICLSPLKYFCGVVSLRVTEKKVERIWMFFRTCAIDRRDVRVFSCRIFGIHYMIFSNSDISYARTADILRVAFRRKAIIFPYMIQVKQDFPEWFA